MSSNQAPVSPASDGAPQPRLAASHLLSLDVVDGTNVRPMSLAEAAEYAGDLLGRPGAAADPYAVGLTLGETEVIAMLLDELAVRIPDADGAGALRGLARSLAVSLWDRQGI